MPKMKIHDISVEIGEDMVIWKDREHKKPRFLATLKYEDNGANESKIKMDLHTGTHADAPFHMLKSGKKLNEIPLGKFIGKCKVLDLTGAKGKITEDILKKFEINKDDIILIKTKNKLESRFDINFPFVDKNGAQYLAKKKIKTLGVDSLGVERDQPNHDTHKILFESGISIIEGLELSKIRHGEYFLIALPLKINADAAPLRAVLVELDLNIV